MAHPHESHEQSSLQDRLVAINRTTKVVKGGRRFGFTALVVVGDGKGRVGFGKGKAKEVADAKTKATEAAKKHLVRVPLREGRTIHHDVIGSFGSGRVVLRSAPPGTGIIAGGPLRAIFESLGIQDVVAKCTGSSNSYNVVRAVFDAFDHMYSPKSVAARRGKKISDIIAQREGNQGSEKGDAELAEEGSEQSAAVEAKPAKAQPKKQQSAAKKPAAKSKKPAAEKAAE